MSCATYPICKPLALLYVSLAVFLAISAVFGICRRKMEEAWGRDIALGSKSGRGRRGTSRSSIKRYHMAKQIVQL